MPPKIAGNSVLVFVMRKLDEELTLILRLRLLIRIIRLTEGETALLSWRGAQVTNGADCRACTDQRRPREKLLTVTTNARVVIRKIGDVREVALRGPGGRDLVTLVAGQALVLF